MNVLSRLRSSDCRWILPAIGALVVLGLYGVWREVIGYWSTPLPLVRLMKEADLCHDIPAWGRDVSGRLLWGMCTSLFIVTVVIALATTIHVLRYAVRERRRWWWYCCVGGIGLASVAWYIAGEPAVVEPWNSMQMSLLSQLPPMRPDRHWNLADTPLILEAIGLVYVAIAVGTCTALLCHRVPSATQALMREHGELAHNHHAAKELRRACDDMSVLLYCAAAMLVTGILQSYSSFYWPAVLVKGDGPVRQTMLEHAASIAAHLGAHYSVLLAVVFGSSLLLIRNASSAVARVVTGSNDPKIVRQWLEDEELESQMGHVTGLCLSISAPLLTGLAVNPMFAGLLQLGT